MARCREGVRAVGVCCLRIYARSLIIYFSRLQRPLRVPTPARTMCWGTHGMYRCLGRCMCLLCCGQCRCVTYSSPLLFFCFLVAHGSCVPPRLYSPPGPLPRCISFSMHCVIHPPPPNEKRKAQTDKDTEERGRRVRVCITCYNATSLPGGGECVRACVSLRHTHTHSLSHLRFAS